MSGPKPVGMAWLGLPLVGVLLVLCLPLILFLWGLLLAGRTLRQTWSWTGRRWRT